MKMNYNTGHIHHIRVSCFIPAKNQSWTQYEDQAKRVQKSMPDQQHYTGGTYKKLKVLQTWETRGKWVLAKWVEKVGLAFGGKL